MCWLLNFGSTSVFEYVLTQCSEFTCILRTLYVVYCRVFWSLRTALRAFLGRDGEAVAQAVRPEPEEGGLVHPGRPAVPRGAEVRLQQGPHAQHEGPPRHRLQPLRQEKSGSGSLREMLERAPRRFRPRDQARLGTPLSQCDS